MMPSTVAAFVLGSLFGGVVMFDLIYLILWGNKL